MIYDAFWNGERYECLPLNCWSFEGNQWYDCDSYRIMETPAFKAATIRLVGGPNDGEIVS